VQDEEVAAYGTWQRLFTLPRGDSEAKQMVISAEGTRTTSMQ